MRIFLSYESKCCDLAESIAIRLRREGHVVFFDRHALTASKEFDRAIRIEIEKSHLFVLLLSPGALEVGAYCQTELEHAQRKWPDPHGHLLPVLIQETSYSTIPPYVQSVTIYEPKGNIAADVTGYVAEIVKGDRKQRLRTWPAVHWRAISICLILITSAYYFLVMLPAGMVLISAGTFTMGSSERAARSALQSFSRKSRASTSIEPEQPDHSVPISRFLIDRFEVNVAEFNRHASGDAGQDHSGPKISGDPNHPAHGITWEEAQAYCNASGKSLPTEAQWEMVARDGANLNFPWGNEAPTGLHANFCDRRCENPWRENTVDDGHGGLAPVGSYTLGHTSHGVNDMSGNVAEWVMDWFDPYYYLLPSASATDAANLEPNDRAVRVARGGSWRSDTYELRSAYRYFAEPETRSDAIGFRCAAPADFRTRLKLKLISLGILR